MSYLRISAPYFYFKCTLISQSISCLWSVLDLPGNLMGADGWAGRGKIFIFVTWSNTLAMILISYWICCSISFRDVGVQMEIAALLGYCISLWLLVISIMSFRSIETCLTQQHFDMLIWFEFNLWLKNSWDGYTATFVKCAHIVWHVVVLVTSGNISLWYFMLPESIPLLWKTYICIFYILLIKLSYSLVQ